MSAAKHTQLPWHAEGNFVCDESGKAIRVWTPGEAKLVAASPQLAKALARFLLAALTVQDYMDAIEKAKSALRLAGRLP